MMGHIYVIAEAGVNHNGSLETALKMVNVAKDAGADAIKFQTFIADKLVTRDAHKSEYQQGNSSGKTQYEMLKNLELSPEDFRKLFKHTKVIGIDFMSSPFDLESVDLLDEIGMQLYKIPSGEITNLPYLKKIGALKKKIIISTGMSNMVEIARALETLVKSGTPKKNITVLHATTEYPAPYEEVNLKAMLTIEKEFKVNVGYSDHTRGIEIAIAAAAMGASVIEKHFTLDRDMPGPDHLASLTPGELMEMIRSVRNIEKAIGTGIKKPSYSELKNIPVVRKSIHYARHLRAGHVLNEEDFIMKRPGIGVSPMELPGIISKKLLHNVDVDSLFKWDDIQ